MAKPGSWKDKRKRAYFGRAVSARRLGVKHSAETKAKMSASHTGLKMSDSAKKKLSELRKGNGVWSFGCWSLFGNFMTRNDIAEIVGVSPTTLGNWLRRHTLPECILYLGKTFSDGKIHRPNRRCDTIRDNISP